MVSRPFFIKMLPDCVASTPVRGIPHPAPPRLAQSHPAMLHLVDMFSRALTSVIRIGCVELH